MSENPDDALDRARAELQVAKLEYAKYKSSKGSSDHVDAKVRLLGAQIRETTLQLRVLRDMGARAKGNLREGRGPVDDERSEEVISDAEPRIRELEERIDILKTKWEKWNSKRSSLYIDTFRVREKSSKSRTTWDARGRKGPKK